MLFVSSRIDRTDDMEWSDQAKDWWIVYIWLRLDHIMSRIYYHLFSMYFNLVHSKKILFLIEYITEN